MVGAIIIDQTAGVTELARRYYDGREPTEKKVSQIISRLDLNGDGEISLPVFLSAAHMLQAAFGSVRPHITAQRSTA